MTNGQLQRLVPRWLAATGIALFAACTLFILVGGTNAAAAPGDLGVAIDDGGATIQPGDSITYTLTLVNSSATMTATQLTAQMTLPFPASVEACVVEPPLTGTCRAVGTDVAIALTGELSPGATHMVKVVVPTPFALTGDVSIAATFDGESTTDGQPMTAAPAGVTTAVQLPALTVQVSDAQTTAQPGQTLLYAVTVTNHGLAPAHAMTTQLTLPSGLHAVVPSVGGVEAVPGSGQITWPAMELGAQSTALFTATARVDVPFLLPAVALLASAQADFLGAVTPVSGADVTVLQQANISGVIWRDLNGNGSRSSAEPGFLDALVTAAGLSSGPFMVRTDSAGGYQLTGLPLDEYVVSVDTGTLPSDLLPTHESDATLDGAIRLDARGPAALVPVVADFGFAAPANLLASYVFVDVNGDNLRSLTEPGIPQVTVTATWPGPDALYGTADDVVETAITAEDGRYEFVGLRAGRQRFRLEQGMMGAGYQLRQDPDSTPNGIFVLNLADRQSVSGQHFIYDALDLQVTKSDQGLSITTESTLPYRISYANRSAVPADAVVITEFVPANSRFNAVASTPGWDCAQDGAPGAHCTFAVGALDAGASGEVYFSVQIAAAMPAHVNAMTNTVQIADAVAVAPDPRPVDNQAVVMSHVNASPDLYISQTDGGSRTIPGNTLVYTMTYQNRGNQAATGVIITQRVPSNTTFNPALSSSGWICTDEGVPGALCTLSVGTLNADSTGQAFFGLDLSASMPVNVASITAAVTISDDRGDADTDNELTPVDSAPDLQLVKLHGANVVEPGAIVHFTLTYTNAGNQDAIGVLIVETVPQYTTFVAAESASGWDCQNDGIAGDNCIYSIGALPAGQGGDVVFAVQVNLDLPVTVTAIGSTAVIAGSGVEQDILNNEAPGSVAVQWPTAIDLVAFTATPNEDGLLLAWRTSAERDTWGFIIYRSTDRSWSNANRITARVIEAQGTETSGASYAFLDQAAVPGVEYVYWLQELELSGFTSVYGPITGKIPGVNPQEPAPSPSTGPGTVGEPVFPGRNLIFLPLLTSR